VICPVQSCREKYSASPPTQITLRTPAVLSHGGAARDRHGRGAGCGGRGCAFRRTALKRTAKSCGSDASTLASSSREAGFSGVTVTKKPDRREEHEVSRKPLRGECRVFPGVTWLTRVPTTNPSAHAAIGRIGRPAFPAPSDEEGGTSRPNLARNMRRERGGVPNPFA
jgi:hypothetical protein